MVRNTNLTPAISGAFFINSLAKVIDHFAANYVSHLIMGVLTWNQVTPYLRVF